MQRDVNEVPQGLDKSVIPRKLKQMMLLMHWIFSIHRYRLSYITRGYEIRFVCTSIADRGSLKGGGNRLALIVRNFPLKTDRREYSPNLPKLFEVCFFNLLSKRGDGGDGRGGDCVHTTRNLVQLLPPLSPAVQSIHLSKRRHNPCVRQGQH